MCQLCSKEYSDVKVDDNICNFVGRCGHKFHESCLKDFEFQCPSCDLKLLKLKLLEEILFKARGLVEYEELLTFFKEIDNDYDIIDIDKGLLKLAVDLGFDLKTWNEPLKILLKMICKNDLVNKLKDLMDLGLEMDGEIGKEIRDLALKFESFEILEAFKFDVVDKTKLITFRLTKWYYKQRDNNTDINMDNINDGADLIHLACIHKDIKMVKFLLSKGIDINCKDNRGFSPLHNFIKYKKINDSIFFLKDLIDLGADIESIDGNDETPLFTAIKMKKTEIIKFLLSKGANKQTPKIKEFGTILLCLLNFYTNTYDWQVMLKSLVPLYLNVDAVDAHGRTCLHELMNKKYHENFVRYLVELRAYVDARDLDGNTPLHLLRIPKFGYDEHSNQRVKLQILIDNRADAQAKNKNGEKAISNLYLEFE